MDPRFLTMSTLVNSNANGTWLFPKLRLVEVYLAFFRVWLRRELQRSKFAHLNLSSAELDEKAAVEEEHYLNYCRRLAFSMFKRGVTSWTVHRESEHPAATGVKQQVKHD